MSEIAVVIQHILKWDFQPERRSRSWQLPIREHRRRIADRLIDSPIDSPSLKARLAQATSRAYAYGWDQALLETGLKEEDLSETSCSYSWIDIMDRPFVFDPA